MLLGSGLELWMPCEGRLWSYLEFEDRVLTLLNMRHGGGCDQYRNIFCWRKTDGELLWQVERAVRPTGEVCEGVYKTLRLRVRQADGSYVDESEEVEGLPEDVLGMWYPKPFRVGVDRLEATTLEDLGCVVEVDYETGRVRALGELDRWGMPLPPGWRER